MVASDRARLPPLISDPKPAMVKPTGFVALLITSLGAKPKLALSLSSKIVNAASTIDFYSDIVKQESINHRKRSTLKELAAVAQVLTLFC